MAGLPLQLYDISVTLSNNRTWYDFDTNVFQWFNVHCPRFFLT